MTGRNSRAMTVKLTPAQTEAFYGAYKAYREGKDWQSMRSYKTTLSVLSHHNLISDASRYTSQIIRDWKFNTDVALPLAIELGFPARYEAEKQNTAAKQQSDDALQSEYRKLLEISDTIAAPRIIYHKEWNNWTVRFTKGINLWGHRNTLDDNTRYVIDLSNIRLNSTAEITEFLKEMYAANTLLAKLQTGIVGKAETKPYEQSALALLPNKVVGS